jgi:hypothetical protein
MRDAIAGRDNNGVLALSFSGTDKQATASFGGPLAGGWEQNDFSEVTAAFPVHKIDVRATSAGNPEQRPSKVDSQFVESMRRSAERSTAVPGLRLTSYGFCRSTSITTRVLPVANDSSSFPRARRINVFRGAPPDRGIEAA